MVMIGPNSGNTAVLDGPEADPTAVPSPYINYEDAIAQHPNGAINTATGEMFDATGNLIGIDPVTLTLANPQALDVEALDGDQLNTVFTTAYSGSLQEGTDHTQPYHVLREKVSKVAQERQRAAERAARNRSGDTDQMPAIVIADATQTAANPPKQGWFDRYLDRATVKAQKQAGVKSETRKLKDEAKTARKELKKFNEEHPRIATLSIGNPEEKARIDARRAELEAQAGGYKAWKTAQRGERRSAVKVVTGLIDGIRRDPAEKAAKSAARTERKTLGNDIADAHRSLVRINSALEARGLSPDAKATLIQERDRQKAILASSHEKRKAVSRRALGKHARKAAEQDAAFEEDNEFPSEEAKELFKDLHNKRIKALKLGLESGYKLRKGKLAYKRAYVAYRKAYIACEVAKFKQAEQEAGGPLPAEAEKALATEIVVDEIRFMQEQQAKLVAEAQGTLRGRAALWFHRQGKGTKLVIGVAAGLVTGGVAGLAGGAIGVVGLAATKAVRGQTTRKASAIATQNGYNITEADQARYLESESTVQAFDRMRQDQMNHVKRTVRKKRVGVFVTGLGLAGGWVAGQWVGDHLQHHDNPGTVGRASAPRPNGGGTAAGGPVAPPTTRAGILEGLTPRPGAAGVARLAEGSGGSGGVVAGAAAEHATNLATHVDTTEFAYPWNWAHANGYSIDELAARATAAGEKVQWHGQGTSRWLDIGGNSDTDAVVNVLNKYL